MNRKMVKIKFATAINCIDGRVQLPVVEWLKKNFGVDYVDMITEAGPVKLIPENNQGAIDSIRKRMDISVSRHQSRLVAIVAHHDCAGNPVAKEKQHEQVLKSMDIIKRWNYNVQVVGLWVDENWKVSEINEQ